MKTCYIFGALPSEATLIKPLDGDLVIAADKGLLNCKQAGIEPDIVIGDFDSLGEIPQLPNTLTFPQRKDDTDSMLALKYGLEKGYNRFILFGCCGGRLDHTLANLQLLSYASQNGALAILCGDTFCAACIKNSSLKFKPTAHGKISLFALNGAAFGVTEKGLSYELENAEISDIFPIGVSNEFTGEEAQIAVKDGFLTVIWDGDINYLTEEF